MASPNITKEDSKFTEMRSKLISQMETIKCKGVLIWKMKTNPEYYILNSLINEVLKVYDMEKIYLSATTIQAHLLQNVRTSNAFRKIDEDFVQLRGALKEFSTNANKTQQSFNNFFDYIGPFFSSLLKVKDELDGAETIDALQNIKFPKLNGLNEMEDMEVYLRVDEWRKLDLSRKYGDILAAMECLCQYL